MSTPKLNTAYVTYGSVVSQADASLFQVNPTLAVGDVKVSIGGAAEVNITTLPVVTPAGGSSIKISLTAAEMNDTVDGKTLVLFKDVAGAEWSDLTLVIEYTPVNIEDLNTVVPMTNTLSQTEHDATQSLITGLNDIAATEIVSAGAITTLSGAVVNVDLVDVTTTNTDIGAAGIGLTDLGGMSTGMKAEVQVEANGALVANHLDHFFTVDYDPSSPLSVGTPVTLS